MNTLYIDTHTPVLEVAPLAVRQSKNNPRLLRGLDLQMPQAGITDGPKF